MTAFSLAYSLHLLAALIWVGGMFFAWMILRPAAVTALEGPVRLKLWVEVFQRFFVWVWLAVVILPISGVGLLQMRFSGFETAPRYADDGKTITGWTAMMFNDARNPRPLIVQRGDTLLVAAMRCTVLAVLGEEVEVPEKIFSQP